MTRTALPGLLLLDLLLFGAGLQAQAPPKRKLPKRVTPDEDVAVLKSSRPAARRGVSCNAPEAPGVGAPRNFLLAALGPDTPRATTSLANPRLFWYVSEPPDPGCQTTFTLMCDPSDQAAASACPQGTRPVEIALPRPAACGIQALDGLGLELRTGVVYRWYVSIGRPADSRSNDHLDGAFLERREAAAGDEPWYDRLAAAHNRALAGNREELDTFLRDLGVPAGPCAGAKSR